MFLSILYPLTPAFPRLLHHPSHHPSLTTAQAAAAEPELAAYLATLEAVHGGAELRGAAEAVLGYERAPVKGAAVSVPPVAGAATPALAGALARLLALRGERGPADGSGGGGDAADAADAAGAVDAALEALRLAAAARRMLAAPIAARLDGGSGSGIDGGNGSGGRLRDLLFLDEALALAARGALEGALGAVSTAAAAGAAAATACAPTATENGGAAAVEAGAAAAEAAGLPLGAALELLALATESAALGVGGVTPGAPGACRAELVLVADQLARTRAGHASGALSPRACALQALAAADRAGRVLAAAASATQAALQPTADALGEALGLTQGGGGDAAAAQVVATLSEEEVRGGPAAALSNLLAALQPLLLGLAGAGGWQVVSRGDGGGGGAVTVAGPLVRVASLAEGAAAIAAAAAGGAAPAGARPLLLVGRVRGDEDVPPGCAGVVVAGSGGAGAAHVPDVLCHAAVRARAVGVPLVACLDAREAARVVALEGRCVALTVDGGGVRLEEATEGATAPAPGAPNPAAAAAAVGITAATGGARARVEEADGGAGAGMCHEWGGEWLLEGAALEAPGAVGAKSANTRRLDAALPDWLKRPASVALPLGAFETGILADPQNAEAAAEIRALEARLARAPAAADRAPLLAELKAAAARLHAPNGLRTALADALRSRLGGGGGDDAAAAAADVEATWRAMLGVLCSRYTPAADAALAAAGLPRSALRVGVLLQPLAPLRYAFVAHTRSPVAAGRAADGEVYVEIVPGLGEALVSGAFPGRALGGAVARASVEAALDAAAAAGGGGSGGGAKGAKGAAALRPPAAPALEELRRAVRPASWPSKSHWLWPAGSSRRGGGGGGASGGGWCVMARSDSNAGEESFWCGTEGGEKSWPKMKAVYGWRKTQGALSQIPTTTRPPPLTASHCSHRRRGPPRLQRRRPLRVAPHGAVRARPRRPRARPAVARRRRRRARRAAPAVGGGGRGGRGGARARRRRQ